jgi:hypothetical protein
MPRGPAPPQTEEPIEALIVDTNSDRNQLLLICGLLVALAAGCIGLDVVLTTEDERNDERLDALERDVTDLRLPDARRLEFFRVSDCDSASGYPHVTVVVRNPTTPDAAYDFYRAALLADGWTESPPSQFEPTRMGFLREYAWGEAGASVRVNGERLEVRAGFSC